MAITTEMKTQVLELYTAYFNRAADTAGVNYWTNEMDTKGWTIDQVAQSFADQAEYTATYPTTMTNAEIVTAVYDNLLGGDYTGSDYWVDQLTAGTVTVDKLIIAVTNAATEVVDGVATHPDSKAIMDNKTAVSQHAYDNNNAAGDISLAAVTTDAATVATVNATADTAIAAEAALVAAYDAAVVTAAASKAAAETAAADVSTVALATAALTAANTAKTDAAAVVTAAAATDSNADDAAAATALTAVETLVTTATAAVTTAEEAAAGETFSLTTDTAAEMLIGTSKNDTYIGDKDSIDANDKFIDSSTTDNDTANLTFNGTLGAVTLANIENINITQASVTAAITVDAANFSGANVLTVNRADVVISGSTITGGTQANIDNLDASKVAKVIAGDNVTVMTVDQVTKAGVAVDATGVTGNITITGATTLTANDTTGTITINNLAVADATEDAKAVSIEAAKATVVDVNDAALTGVISINAIAAADAFASVAGGGTIIAKGDQGTAGTDGIVANAIDDSGVTITTSYVGSATANAEGEIKLIGTAGTSDVATINAAGVTNITNATAVETLNFTGNGQAATYNILSNAATTYAASGDYDVTLAGNESMFSGKTVTGVAVLDLNAGTAGTIDLSKVSATKIDLGFDNYTTNAAASAITVGESATIELTHDQSTQTNFDFDSTTTTGNLNIIAGDDNGTSTAVGTISVANFDAAAGATIVGNVTLDASIANFTATGTTLGAKQTLVITGDEDVTLGTVAAKAVDASASTGIINMTTATSATTVTTGSGADVIVANGAAKHTVALGAGNDTLTITNTNDESSFDTGAGNDTVNADKAGKVYVVSLGDGDDTVATALTDNDAYYVAGAGTDTFTIDSDVDADYSDDSFTMTGFEKINLSAITTVSNSLTLKATQFANNNTVELTDTVGTGGGLKVTGTGTTAVTIDASNVTVTSGSTVAIQYTGSDAADTITGGIAAETFVQTKGADSIEGGATGINTYVATANLQETGSTEAATGTIVNLGTSTITGTSVYSHIGKYLGDGADNVAAGTVAYAYASEDSDTVDNSVVVDTVSGITNVVGSANKDYIVASANDSVLNGMAGNDYIVGGDGADTITGGVGADILVGGAGADIFSFAAGDTGAPTDSNYDTISDYATTEAIDWSTGSASVNSSAVTAASHVAGLAGSGAAATFHADDTTLALHIVAIEAALVDTTHTAGESAHWQEGSDTYIFITDGVSGVGANDILIQLTGVDSTAATTDVLTIATGDLTLA